MLLVLIVRSGFFEAKCYTMSAVIDLCIIKFLMV